jgi:hypothetical protein
MRYYSLQNNERIENIIDIISNSPLYTKKWIILLYEKIYIIKKEIKL